MCKEEEDKEQNQMEEEEVDDHLSMEEGKCDVTEMPNLPKPLTQEEKTFLLAVERGDINTTRKMLQKSHRKHDYINMNCMDPTGQSALQMAIANENLEMVELLVVMGVETRDALLHAIDAEFVEAVDVLLEHEEVVHKDGDDYSWEKADRNISAFTSEITPLIMAAHKDNYEILKILLDRGAMIPMPHDIRCGCPDCIRTSTEDSLRHSRSRINSYRALSSPSLIALTSTDPILTAFHLSLELKNLAYTENEFRADYRELRMKTMKFAEDLLSHARSSTELAVMLNHDPDSFCPYQDGSHMSLKRLELAIDSKQKRFVAHPNIQQLMAALWYEGVPGFRRKSVMGKCLEIIKVVALFPFYCMWYMILPDSATGRLVRTPFMKFLTHSASYLFFLLLLILVSVRFDNLVIWLFGSKEMQLSLVKSMRRQRGNPPTLLECTVALWVFGFLWEELLEIKKDGLKKYLRNMWNLMDVMRDFLYVGTMVLRVIVYVQQSQEIARNPAMAFIPREEWNAFDLQLVSEGLFAAANILSALKLVHIFSINPYLGPLQISLGRMVIDIVKFFFIYTLVLFAFACGLTQLLYYYNDLEKDKCYSLPGGLPDWANQNNACMKWRRFHNLFEASQSLFWAGFGMVGLGDFELTGIRAYTRFWSMLMFGSYSVINIIVLLNLLIAMMSNSYSFIVEHADTEWKFARTKLWMSYFDKGNTLPPPFNMFPTLKGFLRMCGKTTTKKNLIRSMSSKIHHRQRRALDYRYLSVMRALIWRYVCSLQRRKEERPVNEDDISEVKGDISSLRFELIDIFDHNGMNVSMCAKKSRAALGRKMRMWERRLMRDFHVSPAMGSEDVVQTRQEPSMEESAIDKFRRVATLAMKTNTTDDGISMSQIGFGDNQGRESLKVAMEKARRRMEEETPDGSPDSSRGCSPYPDLYTGPHLLDAIKSLELSPSASPSESPMPPLNHSDQPWSPLRDTKDDQMTDANMLTVPGRRSSTSLAKFDGEKAKLSLDVPVNIFPKDSIKKLDSYRDKPAAPVKSAKTTKAPIVMKTESETVQAPVSLPAQEGEGMIRPSQIKSHGLLPLNTQQQQPQPRPAAPKVAHIGRQFSKDGSPPVKVPGPRGSTSRFAPEPRHAAPRPRQPQPPIQNTFTGSDDLQNVDFVRRPARPAVRSSPPPPISVIPSMTILPATPKHKTSTGLAHPSSSCSKPVDPLLKSGESRPADPVVKPADPVVKLADPVVKVADPVVKVAEMKPADPVVKRVDPVVKPADPVMKPADPVVKAADPVVKVADMKAADPVMKPAHPVVKPADPVVKPADPVVKPADPVVKSTETKSTEAKKTAEKKATQAEEVLVDVKSAETKTAPEEKDVPSEPKTKPAEGKEKKAAPKPPKASSPDPKASTFDGNSSTTQTDPLIKPTEGKKKTGWL